MKLLNNYINEKLIINKNIKSEKYNTFGKLGKSIICESRQDLKNLDKIMNPGTIDFIEEHIKYPINAFVINEKTDLIYHDEIMNLRDKYGFGKNDVDMNYTKSSKSDKTISILINFEPKLKIDYKECYIMESGTISIKVLLIKTPY